MNEGARSSTFLSSRSYLRPHYRNTYHPLLPLFLPAALCVQCHRRLSHHRHLPVWHYKRYMYPRTGAQPARPAAAPDPAGVPTDGAAASGVPAPALSTAIPPNCSGPCRGGGNSLASPSEVPAQGSKPAAGGCQTDYEPAASESLNLHPIQGACLVLELWMDLDLSGVSFGWI